jgi:hypothetical protein
MWRESGHGGGLSRPSPVPLLFTALLAAGKTQSVPVRKSESADQKRNFKLNLRYGAIMISRDRAAAVTPASESVARKWKPAPRYYTMKTIITCVALHIITCVALHDVMSSLHHDDNYYL